MAGPGGCHRRRASSEAAAWCIDPGRRYGQLPGGIPRHESSAHERLFRRSQPQSGRWRHASGHDRPCKFSCVFARLRHASTAGTVQPASNLHSTQPHTTRSSHGAASEATRLRPINRQSQQHSLSSFRRRTKAESTETNRTARGTATAGDRSRADPSPWRDRCTSKIVHAWSCAPPGVGIGGHWRPASSPSPPTRVRAHGRDNPG